MQNRLVALLIFYYNLEYLALSVYTPSQGKKKMKERFYVDSGSSAGMRLAKLNLGLPGAEKEIQAFVFFN